MKKIIPIAGLVLSMTVASVNAQVTITENKMNMNTGILTVEGVTDEPNKLVTINIPKTGITPEQLQESDNAGESIIYSGQVSSDDNGEFSFTIDFDGADEGIYELYIGGETADSANKTGTSYVESTMYSELIEDLNEAAAIGEDEFYEIFEPNEEKLFFMPDIKNQDNSVLKEILYNFAKDTEFIPTDSSFNMEVYRAALVAQLISDERVADASALIDEMYVIEEGVVYKYNTVADFATYVDTEEKYEYFASVFEECDTMAEFDEEFANALILTVVKHPGNVTKLQTVFEKYHKYTDANTDDAKLSDYSSISGKDYSSIEDCVKAFNKAVDGDGGGGGRKPSGSSSNSGFGVVTPGSTTVENEKISIKFEDLNPVPWAYSAISELYERKIISGRSETRFAPNDKVTREEFAKMLVEMAGVKATVKENVFSDVDENAWYAGYVNTAYKNGFCNGIGNGNFGTGMEITRQDMCVMAYNVIKALGRNIPDAELVFADADAIGGYAKAPVAALNSAGIVNGVGDNTFNPAGNATRAEAAVIVYKVLMYIG